VPALVSGALGGSPLRRKDGDTNGSEQTASDRIADIAREGLTTMPKRVVEEAKTEVKADAVDATAAAKATLVDAKQTATSAAKSATASAKQAAAAVTTAASAVQKAADAVQQAAAHPSEGTVAQWKTWTAEQLMRVPDIRLYGTMKLNDLVARGPAPARQVWATAKAALGQDWGDKTVDDLLAEWSASH